MTILSSESIHATTVAIDGRAVLLCGSSGTGKSDLGLRLIDRGAMLVSDDYTLVRRVGQRLLATPPATIEGRMEVRGLGILPMPHVTDIPVALMVELQDLVERMPAEALTRVLAGVEVPVIRIEPRPPSAPIKVEMALRQFGWIGDE